MPIHVFGPSGCFILYCSLEKALALVKDFLGGLGGFYCQSSAVSLHGIGDQRDEGALRILDHGKPADAGDVLWCHHDFAAQRFG